MATKPKKLPSGSWRSIGYIYENGKRRGKSFTTPTRKECVFLASQYEQEGRSRRRPQFTVGTAIDKYIADRSAILSASTIRGYKCYRQCYLQSLMDVPLSALTCQMIQQAVNADAACHSPKTTRNALGLLSSALKVALPDMKIKIDLPSPIKYEADIPDDAAVQKLVRLTHGTPIGSAILLGAFAGLRRSEIAALKRSDLDIRNNSIRVNKAMVMNEKGEYVIKSPKSYAGKRTCFLPQFVTDELQKNLPEDSDALVGLTPNAITRAFERTRVKIGLQCRFHDLRHYMASIMLALGVPDKYAMEIMGHSTPDMLKRVYQHTMRKKRTEVKSAILSYFEANCDTNCDTEPEKR